MASEQVSSIPQETDDSVDVRGRPSRLDRSVTTIARFCRRQPLGVLGLVMLAVVVLLAVLAPLIAPYGINETNLLQRLKAPSSDHWFGTDDLGRDQFSRILYGTRTTLSVSLGSVVLALSVSLAVGMACGYIGGWFDTIVQRVVDAWMSFPTLVLLLALVSVLGVGLWQVVGVLAMLLAVGQIRIIRASTLSYRTATFIDAARVLGASPLRIVVRHILPNLFGPLMIVTTLGLSTAILAEASLSFLGFGVPPPAASWGRMLSGSASLYLYKAPWLAIFPGLAISIVVFAVNMLGDALRDELDPRLRGGG